MGRKSLKPGALTSPLPPVLVSVGDKERSNLITIGWTGILSTIPPRTYISVRPERFSHKLLMENGEFVINLTTAVMARGVDFAGIYTGARVNKWEKCGFHPIPSENVAPPTVAESPLSLECRVTRVENMGSHDVFFADIVGVTCDDGALDEKGRIRLDRAGLLAYAHGEYFALGEKVGRFGFSTDKSSEKKTAKNKSLGTAKQKTERERIDAGEKKRPFYLDAPRGGNRKKR